MYLFVHLQGTDIKFEFEDLLPSELTRRTVSDAKVEWNNPALRVIMPGLYPSGRNFGGRKTFELTVDLRGVIACHLRK